MRIVRAHGEHVRGRLEVYMYIRLSNIMIIQS